MQVKRLDSSHTAGQSGELGPQTPEPVPPCCGGLHLRGHRVTQGQEEGFGNCRKEASWSGPRVGVPAGKEDGQSFSDQREACEDGH